MGRRVGASWLHSACGQCRWCTTGRENLCPHFMATGRDVDGGYAELLRVPAASVVEVPEELPDTAAAPWLCAGAIGYRSLRLAGFGVPHSAPSHLGLTGFGASAHLVLQMALYLHPKTSVFVFARKAEEREFALSLGAAWAGAIEKTPPALLDAIIDTTPAYGPLVRALRWLTPGGRLVVNALRKEAGDQDAWLALDYPRDLWMEKEIKSVANVTRADVRDALAVATKAGIHPAVTEFALEHAEDALRHLRKGVRGATVLRIQ